MAMATLWPGRRRGRIKIDNRGEEKMKKLLVLSMALGLLGGLPGLLGQALAKDCGPGPLVIQGNKGSLLQSFGATTNATLLPTQTFAITSGTSGCSSSGIVNRDVEQRFFVAVHLENLSQQMAQGGGAHLDSLANLMGCRTESRARFAALTQRRFGALFPTDAVQPTELLASLKRELRHDPTLVEDCSRIG